MEDDVKLVERMIEVRNDFHLTQEELGVLFDKPRFFVLNYEKGRTKVNVDYLMQFMERFKVNCSWLLFGYGAKYHL